jgi:hypothetical protein
MIIIGWITFLMINISSFTAGYLLRLATTMEGPEDEVSVEENESICNTHTATEVC